MLRVIAVQFKSFKEKIRLVKEFESSGYYVEIYKDIVYCEKMEKVSFYDKDNKDLSVG